MSYLRFLHPVEDREKVVLSFVSKLVKEKTNPGSWWGDRWWERQGIDNVIESIKNGDLGAINKGFPDHRFFYSNKTCVLYKEGGFVHNFFRQIYLSEVPFVELHSALDCYDFLAEYAKDWSNPIPVKKKRMGEWWDKNPTSMMLIVNYYYKSFFR